MKYRHALLFLKLISFLLRLLLQFNSSQSCAVLLIGLSSAKVQIRANSVHSHDDIKR